MGKASVQRLSAIDGNERAKAIKKLEMRAYNEDQTQLFIETLPQPKLAEDILLHCKPRTQLCIAMNLRATNTLLRNHTGMENRLPDMNKNRAFSFFIKGEFKK